MEQARREPSAAGGPLDRTTDVLGRVPSGPSPLAPGRRFGRYGIVGLLGQGGEGRVYEAVLHGPGGVERPVALKVLDRGGDGLRREARIGGLLRHPNLVDVYEVGQVQGTWFAAMEHCAGGSVEALIPLPARAAVEVAIQVARALQYAHEELELVHCDLKPANVLLHGRTVKVADLGIALARGFERRARVAGTPGYMSPEQARGGPVDARSDVYALGVLLGEMILGDAGRGPPTLVVDAPAASPVAARVRSPALQALIDRCVEDDPADRFPTMAAVGAALRQLILDGPGLADVLPAPSRPAPAPRDPRTNLAAGSELRVGREREIGALVEALGAPGVVLLKGPAGIGKSHLARHVARRWLDDGAARAAFVVDLGRARSADDVPRAVADAVGVAVTGDVDVAVGAALAARGPVLLVLDPWEHLPASATELLAGWRRRAPEARLVVTSRAVLGLAEVTTIELSPLSDAEAVALLRARAAERGVPIGEGAEATRLARRLGHLPLALELAAGRLGVLGVDDLLQDLGRLLRGGGEGRHATLKEAVGVSLALLSPSARSLLERLAVFRGPFALEAAEHVATGGPDEPWVVEGVADLLDSSLLRAVGDRFRTIEIVNECLPAAPDGPDLLGAAHAGWFAARGRDGVPGLGRELEDLEAACRFAVSRGDAALAVDALIGLLRLTPSVCPQPVLEAHAAAVATLPLDGAGRAWVALARRSPDVEVDPASEARLCGFTLARQGTVAAERGRTQEAHGLFERAVDALRTAGDVGAEIVVRNSLTVTCCTLGRMDEARLVAEEAAALARERAEPIERARVLTSLGGVLLDLGRSAEAESTLAEALGHAEGIGAWPLAADVELMLGIAVSHQGRVQEALERYQRVVRVAREVAHGSLERLALGAAGAALMDAGRPVEAVEQLQTALALQRQAGNRRLEGVVLGNLSTALVLCGRLEEAVATGEAARAIHAEVGNRRSLAVVATNVASAWLDLGHPERARLLLDEALEVHREVGNARFEGIALDLAGQVASRVGELESAAALHREARAVHARTGNRRGESASLRFQAGVERARGRWLASRALLEEAAASAALAEDETARWLAELALADLDLEEGAAARAGATASAIHAHGVTRDIGALVWGSLLLLARVAARTGRPADCGTHLAEATAAIEANPTPVARVALALARVDLAVARGRLDEATDVLEEARRALPTTGAAAGSPEAVELDRLALGIAALR